MAFDKLNTKALEAELARSMEEEAKYYRVDDMKKRAIKSAPTYDDFRNLVKCAEDNLQPVKAQEIFQTLGAGQRLTDRKALPGSTSSWRKAGKRDADAKGAEKLKPKKAKKIRSYHDFYKVWRRECNDASSKIDFLGKLGPVGLKKVFALEVDTVILTEIIEAINEGTAAAADAGRLGTGLQVLAELAKLDSFGLAGAMLSKSDKENVASILKRCESDQLNTPDKQELAEFIAKSYEL